MKYIPVYENWLHFIRYMESGEEVARFFEAVFEYLRNGVGPKNLTPISMMSFGIVRPFLDESKDRWNRRAEANRRNGQKGAQARLIQRLAEEDQ